MTHHRPRTHSSLFRVVSWFPLFLFRPSFFVRGWCFEAPSTLTCTFELVRCLHFFLFFFVPASCRLCTCELIGCASPMEQPVPRAQAGRGFVAEGVPATTGRRRVPAVSQPSSSPATVAEMAAAMAPVCLPPSPSSPLQSPSFPDAFPYYVSADNLRSFLQLLAKNPLERFGDTAFMRQRLWQVRDDLVVSANSRAQPRASGAPTVENRSAGGGFPPSDATATVVAAGQCVAISTARPLAAQQGTVVIPVDFAGASVGIGAADGPAVAKRKLLDSSPLSGAEDARKRARRSGRTTSPPAGMASRASVRGDSSSDDEDSDREPRPALPGRLAVVPELTDADGAVVRSLAIDTPLCSPGLERFCAASTCMWAPLPAGEAADRLLSYTNFCERESKCLRGQGLTPFDAWHLHTMWLASPRAGGALPAPPAAGADEARRRADASQWLAIGPGASLLFPGEGRPWTPEERVLFARGLSEQGRAFGQMRRTLLQSRTTAQLVNYYYQRHKQAWLQHGGSKAGHLFDRGHEGTPAPPLEDRNARRVYLSRAVATLRQLAATAGDGFPPDRGMVTAVTTFRRNRAARVGRCNRNAASGMLSDSESDYSR